MIKILLDFITWEWRMMVKLRDDKVKLRLMEIELKDKKYGCNNASKRIEDD